MTETRGGLPILLFADAAGLAAWIAAQGDDGGGAWLRFARKGSGLTSIGKADAIDVALCHGWIDGQSARHDDASWLIRFTPRRPRSLWSAVNVRRAETLITEGRVTPRGMAAIEAARRDGRWAAAYAPASEAGIPDDLRVALEQVPAAAAFFATLTGANRYAVLHRIATVRRAETRAKRIAQFVTMLARGETVY